MSSTDATPSGVQEGNAQTVLSGNDRILRFLGYMFARHEPGEKTPPLPAELAEWAQDTFLATGAGMFLSGFMQWREERAAGPLQPPPDAPSKAHAAKAMAEEQMQRLLRVANSALKGSLRFGGLAAVFYGAELAGGVYRGRHDFYNSAVGGMAAGALLGASLMNERGVAGRGRGAVLGAALGASIGVPAGLLQDYIADKLPPEQKRQRQLRQQQTEDIIAGEVPLERPEAPVDYDPAGAVIRQLEASLAGSPTGGGNGGDKSEESESDKASFFSEHQKTWWKPWSRSSNSRKDE